MSRSSTRFAIGALLTIVLAVAVPRPAPASVVLVLTLVQLTARAERLLVGQVRAVVGLGQGLRRLRFDELRDRVRVLVQR